MCNLHTLTEVKLRRRLLTLCHLRPSAPGTCSESVHTCWNWVVSLCYWRRHTTNLTLHTRFGRHKLAHVNVMVWGRPLGSGGGRPLESEGGRALGSEGGRLLGSEGGRRSAKEWSSSPGEWGRATSERKIRLPANYYPRKRTCSSVQESPLALRVLNDQFSGRKRLVITFVCALKTVSQ